MSKLENVLHVLHVLQWIGLAVCLPLMLLLFYALAIQLLTQRTKDKTDHDSGEDRTPER